MLHVHDDVSSSQPLHHKVQGASRGTASAWGGGPWGRGPFRNFALQESESWPERCMGIMTQAVQERLPHGKPPPETESARHRQWREQLQTALAAAMVDVDNNFACLGQTAGCTATVLLQASPVSIGLMASLMLAFECRLFYTGFLCWLVMASLVSWSCWTMVLPAQARSLDALSPYGCSTPPPEIFCLVRGKPHGEWSYRATTLPVRVRSLHALQLPCHRQLSCIIITPASGGNTMLGRYHLRCSS